MTNAESQGLRGFDSYSVRLGDELRGERASKGKSLLDVQRELRIKAAHIDAIENADPSSIPHVGYVCGYVRAYARYLELDEGVTLRRFCAESGFVPQTPIGRAHGTAGRGSVGGASSRRDLDAVIAGSRLAAISRTETFNGELGATLRGLGSLAVLATIVAGLGYGGLTLLENIQRVDFSPLPQAPTALASVPGLDFESPASPGFARGPAPDMSAIAAVYAAQEVMPPSVDLRDGPISTIDPAQAGIYARNERAVALRDGEAVAVEAIAPRPAMAAVEVLAAAPVVFDAGSEAADPTLAAAVERAPAGVALVIADEAWLRVSDSAGNTLHEALMQPGARWDAPADAEGLVLRAGNAGGVYIEVDGETFGPVGGRGEVVSGVSLDGERVRDLFETLSSPLTTSALGETLSPPR